MGIIILIVIVIAWSVLRPNMHRRESPLRYLGATPDPSSHVLEPPSAEEKNWCMFIHIAQYCTYIIPIAGLAVPLVLWLLKKDESGVIDLHGKIVMNWIITEFILALVFGLLCFVVIGFPLLFALMALGVIFPILGAVKAQNGEAWPYPLSLRFFNHS